VLNGSVFHNAEKLWLNLAKHMEGHAMNDTVMSVVTVTLTDTVEIQLPLVNLPLKLQLQRDHSDHVCGMKSREGSFQDSKQRQANNELWQRKYRWTGHVLRHDGLLYELSEGRMRGKQMREKNSNDT